MKYKKFFKKNVKVPLVNLCFEIQFIMLYKNRAEGVHCFMCIASSYKGPLIKSTVNVDAHRQQVNQRKENSQILAEITANHS